MDRIKVRDPKTGKLLMLSNFTEDDPEEWIDTEELERKKREKAAKKRARKKREDI
jgi:hypothetical protein